jgi:hypothetical protein
MDAGCPPLKCSLKRAQILGFETPHEMAKRAGLLEIAELPAAYELRLEK